MEDLVESILDYVRADYTDYAIMINGEWGSGKTYFWNHKIKNKIDFDAEVAFAFDKLRYPIATGSLMAVLDVVSTTSKQISIGVTIPPGGTLVIDCENYTAYLDGVNVYKFYEGDWLQLSRDTLSVAVDSGTGGVLSGTLSYVERYL